MTIDSFMIMLPAFIAGLLIITTHVPLGTEVLKRGIIFIDLAIAQIAGLGVITATLYFHTQHLPFITQLVAFGFACCAAFGFKLCETYFPKLQEAIIGSTYVFASSMALLILANHSHGLEEVETLLAGQLLWVSWQNIIATTIIYLGLLIVIANKTLLTRHFHLVFALTITISVQLAGVFFVFASLILPALAAALCHKNSTPIFAYCLAFMSLLLGLIISLITDLPTGPTLVCTLCFMVVGVCIVKKRLSRSSAT